MNELQNKSAQLQQGLGLKESVSVVIGTIIGTGIFLKTATMAQTVGSPSLVMLAWIAAGLLSLTGALTYAELGSMFPKAGGEYVYLKEAYGDATAFLYGWMRFWIGAPGSIAAYAVGSATFLNLILHFDNPQTVTFVAISFILVFSTLNCLSVSFGGKMNVVMTTLKIVIIFTIIYGVFFLSTREGFQSPVRFEDVATSWKGWSFFGTAVLAALWAYDGWNNLPMLAGEVKNSSKTVPLALIIGTVSIVIIYGLVNVSYFSALPFNEVLTANSRLNSAAFPVATKAAMTFLGELGIVFLSAAMTISALGAMNGSIMTSARVPFAMAQDGLFFRRLARLNSRRSPATSVLVQAVIAIVLALSGTFDQLTDYVIFAAWLFYALCGASVIIFRRNRPQAQRNYKVWGYPVVPILFVTCATLLLINTVMTSPRETLVGLFIIACGWPCYRLYFRKTKT